jgi:ATP-dependent metalloprotease FtsH
MSTLNKNPKLPEYISALIDKNTYEQLTKLANTFIQPKIKFEAIKTKAREIAAATNEKNKNKSPGEELEKPASTIPEVQAMFSMTDEEYEKFEKTVSEHDNKNFSWLTYCCNIGLLPKSSESDSTGDYLLRMLYIKEYELFLKLTNVVLENPAVEFETIKKAVHEAIACRKPENKIPIVQKWLNMTAGEYYAAIDAAKYWNNKEKCDLLTLYCRAAGLLPAEDPSAYIESMQNDSVILENAYKNSREKSLPELPGLIEKSRGIQEKLLETVFGQEQAVSSFCEGLFGAEVLTAGNQNRKRPKAVFMFAGPPGTGKSYLAEQAAELLKIPQKRFDMANYSNHSSHLGLIGFEYTWRSSTPGTLTTFVRENPRCILIFDEIEAAHTNTIEIFCSLLEDGVVTDNYLETRKVAALSGSLKDEDKPLCHMYSESEPQVSFRDAIIIFTSNAGRSLYEQNIADVSRKTLLNALKTEINPQTKEPYFPASIVSRIAAGEPILFNRLKPEHLEKIIRNEFNKCRILFLRQYGVDVTADENISVALLLRESGNSDARSLRAQSELFFKKQIYEMFSSPRIEKILPKLKLIHFEAELNKLTDEIKPLFLSEKAEQEHKILYFEVKPVFTENKILVKLRNFEIKRAPDAGDVKDFAEKPGVTFGDVIGLDGVKEELKYFIRYLQNPKEFLNKGRKPPKGVLLYGPPGTGKTLLAKAMAGESGTAFFHIGAAMFTSAGHVGVGQKAVTELFVKARRYAPSIIFIDEIDAIGRTKGYSGSAHAEEMALNALLTEVDGFDSRDPERPVFVLAATNFDVGSKDEKNVLDPALVRRFDRCVEIGFPNKEDRIKYLISTLGKQTHNVSNALIELFAERSALLSIANLSAVIELANRNAGRQNRVLDDVILMNAFDEILHGAERVRDEKHTERVAWHEAGHAYLSWLSGGVVNYLSIVSRGNFGGYSEYGLEDESYCTREILLSRIRRLLGGRATEIVFYGDENGLSAGAAEDFKMATQIAKSMIVNYGMDDEFGLAFITPDEIEKGLLAVKIHEKVNVVLKSQMEEAVRLIKKDFKRIDILVDALLEKRSLNRLDIEKILSLETEL